LQDKINLRRSLIPQGRPIKILDCYHGSGNIWNQIKNSSKNNIKVLGIDKQNYSGNYLKGNNLKFISSMNLDQFDAIDLDSYGIPFKQLEIIFAKEYHGLIFITFIQSVYGCINKKLLLQLGYNDNMIKKIPSLFNKNGFVKFKNYLSTKGIKRIKYINKDNKYYIEIST
jgi:hypothetical protein